MNDTGSTLVAHCGARKVTREELIKIPVPEGTRTHQPLSHFKIVEVLEEALSFRYLKVVRDEYAVSSDGMKMFGVMDLNAEFSGCRFSVGMRNSNDKSMRLALTAGFRVFVCDNLAFSGDFTPLLHKHTKNLELIDVISIAVDRIHRGFEPLKQKVQAMRTQSLTEDEVKLIIYQAFLDRNIKGVPRHLMPVVHEHYFHPKHEAFYPRNLWSLSNAFTSAFKRLAPVKQFEVTAKLGSYLSAVQENLARRREIEFNPQRPEQEDGNAATLAGTGETDPAMSPESLVDSGSASNFQLPVPPDNICFFACGKGNIAEDRGFDEDDVAKDPYEREEFEEYFDEEAEIEAIDEAKEELLDEYIRRAA